MMKIQIISIYIFKEPNDLFTIRHSEINVASSHSGATCTSLPLSTESCYNSLDGSVNTVWEFRGNALDAQMVVYFGAVYKVSMFRFRQPYWSDDKNFRTLQLEFRDGSIFKVCPHCLALRPALNSYLTLSSKPYLTSSLGLESTNNKQYLVQNHKL